MRTMPAPAYGQLTRNDLAAFGQESKELILKAIDAGCVARISNKGHCILRNSAGGTASVPRNLNVPNRTAQNTRAELKRLLTEQRQQQEPSVRPSTFRPRPGPTTTRPVETTVADAFITYGAPFSQWFSRFPNGLSPSARVRVAPGPEQKPRFELVDDQGRGSDGPAMAAGAGGRSADPAEPKDQPTATGTATTTTSTAPAQANEPTRHRCSACGRYFPSRTALAGHTKAHRLPDTTPDGITARDLADANAVVCKTVRARLRAVGSVTENGSVIVSIRAALAAGLTLPDGAASTPEGAPASAPAVPSESPGQERSPEAVLDEIRAALGPDPRVAELEAHVHELQGQLQQQRALAEEAQTRLTLIRDAMSV